MDFPPPSPGSEDRRQINHEIVPQLESSFHGRRLHTYPPKSTVESRNMEGGRDEDRTGQSTVESRSTTSCSLLMSINYFFCKMHLNEAHLFHAADLLLHIFLSRFCCTFFLKVAQPMLVSLEPHQRLPTLLAKISDCLGCSRLLYGSFFFTILICSGLRTTLH